MSEKERFRVSVRDLVAATETRGDLRSGYAGSKRAVLGIKGHQTIQAQRMAANDRVYEKEVSLSVELEQDHFILKVFGRADGVFPTESGFGVEEIKTCRRDPALLCENPRASHLAQLKCYGHMLARARNLETVELVLTYAQIRSHAVAEACQTCTASELAEFFKNQSEIYLSLLSRRQDWKRIRNQSIESLEFPFGKFRKGQRDLAEAVFRIIKHQKILFARAPTGTGKTIATLFPALKAMGLGHTQTLFYLTAKTPGKRVACQAVSLMAEKGLRLKTMVLTAKRQICFTSDQVCDMDNCPYAHAYFTKLPKAMARLKDHDLFDRERIEDLAREFDICPFELSLDLSLECDLIICDLNYAFDPRVYLKRFFDRDKTDYTFLVDEAHNLPDRLRSMYSAPFFKTRVLEIREAMGPSLEKMDQALEGVEKAMDKLSGFYLSEVDFQALDHVPEYFLEPLADFCDLADLWLERHHDHPVREELLDVYYEAAGLLSIYDYFDHRYECFLERTGSDDLDLLLFCRDPSAIFSSLIKRSASTIFFSATFYPREYYQTILFGDRIQPYAIELPSPFDRNNLGLFIHTGIETTYRKRESFYEETARTIRETIAADPGNYLVFFPAYRYLEDVARMVEEKNWAHTLLIQESGMAEEERQAFLDTFQTDTEVTGFAVMGGIFGEGIDLVGDRLKGVVIVGVGLPQICPEQESIRNFWDRESGSGFFHAYRMPGFNRVLQAAGRVIRTESDRGVVVLLDRRFAQAGLKSLFPGEWTDPGWVRDTAGLARELKKFWQG